MRLTGRFRVKAARALAAFYAFCLVVPIAGFVLADSAWAHCLTPPVQIQRSSEAAHDHQAMAHETMSHAGHDRHATAETAAASDGHAGMTDGGTSGTPPCCGVMCASALPASPFELTLRSVDHAPVLAGSDAGISGEAPDTLYRPPIVLLSL